MGYTRDQLREMSMAELRALESDVFHFEKSELEIAVSEELEWRRKHLLELYKMAYACIESEEYERAIELFNEYNSDLTAIGISGSFTYLSLAYELTGRLEQAIKVLEDGIAECERRGIPHDKLSNDLKYLKERVKL